MSNDLHHVSLFVADMERALHLFRNLLSFELVWRAAPIGGRKLSAVLGIPNIKAELAFLRSRPDSVAVELVHMIQPSGGKKAVSFSAPGTVVLTLIVEDLQFLHQRLTEEGWAPLTSCVEMRTPEGDPVRVFCFRTQEGITIELIEQDSFSSQNG